MFDHVRKHSADQLSENDVIALGRSPPGGGASNPSAIAGFTVIG
jgi:hypothetical protein